MKAYRNKNLITIINEENQTIELHSLNIAAADKRDQGAYESELIDKLFEQSQNPNTSKAEEAIKALVYYDAFYAATMHSNFSKLNKIQETTTEFKREAYNSRNSRQRDILNLKSTQKATIENNPEIESGMSLGALADMADNHKAEQRKVKKALKKKGLLTVPTVTKEETPYKASPVKTLSKDEIQKLYPNRTVSKK